MPIQGRTATPVSIVDLTNPGSSEDLQWGPIQPVSQLGSQQLTSGKLAKNADGSVTIWIAPKLPARGTHDQLDPDTVGAVQRGPLRGASPAVPTQIRPMIRMLLPDPGK